MREVTLMLRLVLTTTDMGLDTRRNDILLPFTSLLILRHIICESKEIQVYLSLRLPGLTFRSTMEVGRRKGAQEIHIEGDNATCGLSTNVEI